MPAERCRGAASSAIEITCEVPHRPTVRLHVPCYLAWITYAHVHAQAPGVAPAAGPLVVYLRGSTSDLALLDTYLGASATRLPFSVDSVRGALRHCPGPHVRSDAQMSLPLPSAVAGALKAWLAKDAAAWTRPGTTP